MVYSSNHLDTIADMSLERLKLLTNAWIDRYTNLLPREDIAFVMPFENRGEECGVTLHHPHGQIYCYPYIPPVIEKEIELIKNRTDLYNFVSDIPELEKKKYALINQQTLKRIELEFNKTPIFSNDKFLAGSVMISSSKFEGSKISINNMIILSCFIGIIIGVLYVIMQNTFLIKLKSRRN